MEQGNEYGSNMNKSLIIFGKEFIISLEEFFKEDGYGGLDRLQWLT